ncbi:uncharacterized protein RAG0_05661 [Rhynchosporium agropyri]|uniref:Uncharacterized protein n=1 Tax=Rhynchosporium agropyri TaxID=914238 RepID=A0A1E1KE69_9HELO|nr:uncharacterized protein RAG0_05661 [Rhynchosporium agropyri]
MSITSFEENDPGGDNAQENATVGWPFECEIQDANESSPKMMFQIYSFPDKDFLNTFVLDFLDIAFDERCTIRDLSKKYPETPPRFETVKKARLRLYVIVRRVQQLYASFRLQSSSLPFNCGFRLRREPRSWILSQYLPYPKEDDQLHADTYLPEFISIMRLHSEVLRHEAPGHVTLVV